MNSGERRKPFKLACMKGNQQLTKWFVFNINRSNEESSKSGHEMGKQSRPVWLTVPVEHWAEEEPGSSFSQAGPAADSARTEVLEILFVGPVKCHCGAIVCDQPPQLETCSLASRVSLPGC